MAKNIDLSKIKCTGFQFIFDIFDQDLSGKIGFLEYMLVVRETIM